MFLFALFFGGILLWPATEALNGHFFMIGDVHVDLSYRNTSESCNSDIPNDQLGQYGDYECDSPYKLVESSVMALKEEYEKHNADFVVWMGDSPTHLNKDLQWTKESFLFHMENASRLMDQHLTGKVVIPVIGNHDYFPKNQLPAASSEIYDAIGEMWKQWLPGDALEDFLDGGFYTLPISTSPPKLRAIVLNTNLNLKGNKEAEGEEDPGNQFQWLQIQLDKAINNDEKVHLILHIPTGAVDTEPKGSFFMREGEHIMLNNIIREYSTGDKAVILGAYGTHVHTDSYKMYYDNGIPVGTIFISPSVTPWRWDGSNFTSPRNPAMRMFDFDPQQLHLTDIKQYYLQLPEANSQGNANWKLEYSFQDAHDVSDISPTSLHQLLAKFKKGDAEFQKYIQHNSVSINPEDTPHYDGVCDCQCKATHLCSIEFIDKGPWTECMKDTFPLTCGAIFCRSAWSGTLLMISLVFWLK